jgi:hypothetical protein
VSLLATFTTEGSTCLLHLQMTFLTFMWTSILLQAQAAKQEQLPLQPGIAVTIICTTDRRCNVCGSVRSRPLLPSPPPQ